MKLEIVERVEDLEAVDFWGHGMTWCRNYVSWEALVFVCISS